MGSIMASIHSALIDLKRQSQGHSYFEGLHRKRAELNQVLLQWSLYFKTTHGTKNMWFYIAGGIKIKVILHRKLPFGTKSSGLVIKGGLKIEGCKIEGASILRNNI